MPQSRTIRSSLLAGLSLSALLLAGCASTAVAEQPDTSGVETAAAASEAPAVDEKYVWDLTDLYATAADWNAARLAVLERVETLKTYEGTLGESAEAMAAAMTDIGDTYKQAARVYTYASLSADVDVSNSDTEADRQLAQLMYAELSSSVSWLDPELLAVGEETAMAYVDAAPELEPFRFYIEDVLRRAPHTLDTAGESILAATSLVTSGPGDIYNLMANSDMPWPEITLSTGETVTITQAGYSRYRQAPNREDRKAVFDAFWGTWGEYENTYGAIYSAQLQGLQLDTKQRHYDSSVERALFDDAMPAEVYETLIEQVHESLPTLHRYFRLRKRMLGIEGDMGYYDIYPPLVQLDKTFTIEDSIALSRRALAPLGDEFLAAFDTGVEGRWMHVYPSPTKRSGAYMNGSAYDVHPYVLLNHNDDYDGASTFAHEYGHAVHSVLANAAQPWATADYSTFVAETASIMNEMLLQDLVTKEAQTPEERLYYLGYALETLRGTYFRQAMFAEFEYRANALADAGEPVTGAKLTEIYLDLLKQYHGDAEGVVKIDDAYGIEWAYIPHFYYDFYVFQYATSIAGASSLAEQISSGDTEARDRYIDLLKAGGSDHPYDLVKAAGVDLATPAPYQALDRRANAIMDEMEAILAEMEADGAE